MATDGSCLKNGQEDAQAGAGVYCETDNSLTLSVRLPWYLRQSNQTGEAVATLLATQTAGRDTHLIEETDSRTVMNSVTSWRRRHENQGFIGKQNSALTAAIIAAMRHRKAGTYAKCLQFTRLTIRSLYRNKLR